MGNPQVTYKATEMCFYRNWERQIRNIGTQWCDLDMLAIRSDYVPFIYLKYGNYSADKSASDTLVLTLINKHCLLMIRKEDWKDHTVNALYKKHRKSSSIF
ncbi:hypothetical protein GCM10007161_06090 [Ignatzschineria indica]|uniref:hypothetical protein n=1 Tax=Ignatzschineria indica TaxID=472583 RepID=UPI001057F8BD|nr:hypothetical protein [Ignatzschineria indica]GGZ77664.1 hypothetical protein GCM10007161_06090 [Ignatzschineria indica]